MVEPWGIEPQTFAMPSRGEALYFHDKIEFMFCGDTVGGTSFYGWFYAFSGSPRGYTLSVINRIASTASCGFAPFLMACAIVRRDAGSIGHGESSSGETFNGPIVPLPQLTFRVGLD
jgi:hypothetical protein